MSILQKVRETIDHHNLLSTGDSVLVALSGGPDSVALLKLIVRLRSEYELSISAFYLNHLIRPRIARKEAVFCMALCKKLKVDFVTETADVPAIARDSGCSLEEAARNARYDALERSADSEGHSKIAIGHHRDDRAETILFRILRGTGPAGLAGIPVKRGRIIRPLYDITRDDILAYLQSCKQTYCKDNSNSDLRFRRNLIRHRLLPVIREKINPQASSALISLGEIAEEQESFLKGKESRALRQSLSISSGGKFCLDLKRLLSYDEWLLRRLLRRCLMAISGKKLPPSRETVLRLERLANKSAGSVSLPGKIQASCEKGLLIISRGEIESFETSLESGSQIPLPLLNGSIRCEPIELANKEKRASRRDNIVQVDLDRLNFPLVVRTIRPGDRFYPLGMKGSKKVGDYLTDRQVPVSLRDEVIIVTDRKRIIWLVGYEISDQVRMSEKTRRILRIEYRHRKRPASFPM